MTDKNKSTEHDPLSSLHSSNKYDTALVLLPEKALGDVSEVSSLAIAKLESSLKFLLDGAFSLGILNSAFTLLLISEA